MKLLFFVCVPYLILILSIGKTSLVAAANENKEFRMAVKQCESYAYRAIRPLLDQVQQLKAEVRNINNNSAEKDQEIKELKKKLDHHNVNAAFIEELRDQIDFYKKTIELTSIKLQELENQLKVQKTVAQKDQQISNIQNDIENRKMKLHNLTENPQFVGCTSFGDVPGIQKINSPNYSIDVLCDSETAGPGWTVIQQRINGKEDFRRDWATYRQGFGSFDGDFFLGLENIHRLTNTQPHEIYIHMENSKGVIKYANYHRFAIAGERDKYRLSLGDLSGNVTFDFLRKNKNQQFSTYDHDNDNYVDNSCAELFGGGGWWYNDCGDSKLNGRYYVDGKFHFNGIYINGSIQLQKVKMLIRPAEI